MSTLRVYGPLPSEESMKKRVGDKPRAKAVQITTGSRNYGVLVWAVKNQYPYLEWVRRDGQMLNVEVEAYTTYRTRRDGKTEASWVAIPGYMLLDPVTMQPFVPRPATE